MFLACTAQMFEALGFGNVSEKRCFVGKKNTHESVFQPNGYLQFYMFFVFKGLSWVVCLQMF